MRPRYESPASIKPHFLAFPVLLALCTVRHVKSQPFPLLTLHAAYICAHSSVFIMYFLLFLTPTIHICVAILQCLQRKSFRSPYSHCIYFCVFFTICGVISAHTPFYLYRSPFASQRVKQPLALRPSRIRSAMLPPLRCCCLARNSCTACIQGR